MTEGGTLVSKELGKELVNNELEGGMLVRREGGVGRGEGWSAEPARDLGFKVNKVIIVKEHKQNISGTRHQASVTWIPEGYSCAKTPWGRARWIFEAETRVFGTWRVGFGTKPEKSVN